MKKIKIKKGKAVNIKKKNGNEFEYNATVDMVVYSSEPGVVTEKEKKAKKKLCI